MKSILRESFEKVLTNDFIHKYVSKAYFTKFPGSQMYWETRYRRGDTSGSGSYGRLAEFKADVIESFIDQNDITSVIEFGCGDGNQISLIDLPQYVGFDVSIAAIERCKDKFEDDPTKSFFLYNSLAFHDVHEIFQADLTISLDVIYHITEDKLYEEYMNHLFGCSDNYVIIYSSNVDEEQDYHIKRKKFTAWITENIQGWELAEKIDNKYPSDPTNPDETSKSDFYIYNKIS